MLRFRELDLIAWHQAPSRKPLILRGARQVGKTTLVSHMAEKLNLTLHSVNLERHTSLRDSIESFNVEAFLRDVQLISKNGSPEKADSLLFIDEIQAIPKAITLLRYLYEEKKEIAVIAAGSLLEFALSDEDKNFTMPVGRVEYLFLGPLTFKEFLLAADQKELINFMEAYELNQRFSVTAHDQLRNFFKTYLMVGGMPEAVSDYVQNRDLKRIAKIHASIVSTYRDDFSKYAKRSALAKLQRIFDYAPVGLGKKVKYVNIDRDSKSLDVKNALQLLEMAQVITCAYANNSITPPLAAKRDFNAFKLYFLDCGLVNTLSDFRLVPLDIENMLLQEGEIAEQFVAQHLAYFGQGYQRPTLHYWLREGRANNAEVDFIVANNSEVVPVEVKAGLSGTLKSLHQFISRTNCPLAVRFDLNVPTVQKLDAASTSEKNKQITAKLISLPIYMVEEMQRLIIQHL